MSHLFTQLFSIAASQRVAGPLLDTTMRLFTSVMFIVLSATFVVAADTLPASPPVPAVAVVKDWADLLAQPLIDLGGGVRIRLGLEAATCAAGSGVLLYCLTGESMEHLAQLEILDDTDLPAALLSNRLEFTFP